MPDYQLVAEPPLAGLDRTFGKTRLSALSDLALVSVALPLGQETAAQQAIRAAYGIELPQVGSYATAPADGALLIRTGPDQGMIAFDHVAPDAGRVVASRLNGAVYTTDQTDAWVGLMIDGPQARAALERICPLDLHPDAFGPEAAQRTVAEHLGLLVLRRGDEAFLLLSASSSAESFAHAVETSICWVT